MKKNAKLGVTKILELSKKKFYNVRIFVTERNGGIINANYSEVIVAASNVDECSEIIHLWKGNAEVEIIECKFVSGATRLLAKAKKS